METMESAPFHGPLSGHRPALADLVKPYLKHGDREYLARLLQIWSPANDEDRANDAMGNALHHAISRGDETAVRMMLDAGVSPTVLQPHDPGYTPLLAASEAGHRGIARLLWQLVGPDGRADPESGTCLELAAWKGHVDMVADFFDLWDGWSTDETREALHAAASDWRDDVVGFLLAKVSYEADVVQTALERGITGPGMLPGRVFASRQAGAITTAEQDLRLHHVVTQLVDAGASPHGNTRTGVPLLHLTVQSSRLGALKGLLKKGANANVQDKTGKTALHKLFRRTSSSTPSLCTLLQHGASPEIADEAGETALHAAAYTGTLDQLQVCLASCRDDAAVHLCTSHGESLLHYAAAGGRNDTVEFLSSRGLDVNLANANGWTPLTCALMPTPVRSPYPDCALAHFLLRQGASADVVTHEGWTPLHGLATYSASSANRDLPPERWEGVAPLVRELILRGAPLDAKASVLRSRPATGIRRALIDKSAWGVRLRWFAQEAAPNNVLESETLEEQDTTPQMWASRSGATQVFDAIQAHLAPASEGETQEG